MLFLSDIHFYQQKLFIMDLINLLMMPSLLEKTT